MHGASRDEGRIKVGSFAMGKARPGIDDKSRADVIVASPKNGQCAIKTLHGFYLAFYMVPWRRMYTVWQASRVSLLNPLFTATKAGTP